MNEQACHANVHVAYTHNNTEVDEEGRLHSLARTQLKTDGAFTRLCFLSLSNQCPTDQ